MTRVTLPQLSLSMEEGRIVRWLVADGARVAVGQPILEVETDKAVAEVEAPATGVLRRLADEGATLAVDAPLAEIVETAEPPEPRGTPHSVASDATSTADAGTAAESGRTAAQLRASQPEAGSGSTGARKHRASPAARRVARERGIDLSQVIETGHTSRITVRDLAHLDPVPARPAASGAARLSGIASSDGKTPSMRRAIVAHLEASWRDIPHIHIGGELDGSGLAAAKRSARTGLTVTDLLVVAVVRALRDVPELNGEIGRPTPSVHLALAVATPEGIVAPVIRNADRLSLGEIAEERTRLVTAARDARLDRRDLAGGTFTLTNLGAFPVDFFTPIVSGPQLAMLATGRLVERAVAIEGIVSVRHRIWMNIAIDHRGADGIAGARFLAAMERRMNELEG